jgi:hypothetical protein
VGVLSTAQAIPLLCGLSLFRPSIVYPLLALNLVYVLAWDLLHGSTCWTANLLVVLSSMAASMYRLDAAEILGGIRWEMIVGIGLIQQVLFAFRSIAQRESVRCAIESLPAGVRWQDLGLNTSLIWWRGIWTAVSTILAVVIFAAGWR